MPELRSEEWFFIASSLADAVGGPMSGKNQRLVADKSVEIEK